MESASMPTSLFTRDIPKTMMSYLEKQKWIVVVGYLDQHHFFIQGQLYLLIQVKTVIRHFVQDLKIIDGGITLSEHSPEMVSIKSTKQGLTVLRLLFNPVIKIVHRKDNRKLTPFDNPILTPPWG
jgi:hypothetical protein